MGILIGTLIGILQTPGLARVSLRLKRPCSSVFSILPYRSIEPVEDLVLKTWEISDDENRKVFF